MTEPFGAFRVSLDDELSPRDPSLHLLQHSYYSAAQVLGCMVFLVGGRLKTSYDDARVQFVHVSASSVIQLTRDPRVHIDRLVVSCSHEDSGAHEFGEVECLSASADHQQVELKLKAGCVLQISEGDVRRSANLRNVLPVVWRAPHTGITYGVQPKVSTRKTEPLMAPAPLESCA